MGFIFLLILSLYSKYLFFSIDFKRLEPYHVLLALQIKINFKWLLLLGFVFQKVLYCWLLKQVTSIWGLNKMSFCVFFFLTFPLIKEFAFLINQYLFNVFYPFWITILLIYSSTFSKPLLKHYLNCFIFILTAHICKQRLSWMFYRR